MRKPSPSSLLSLSLRAFRLGVDAQTVASLRFFQAATGRASSKEATRMVDEKVTALFEAQQAAFFAFATGRPGAAPGRVLGVYSRKVAANRKRLSSL